MLHRASALAGIPVPPWARTAAATFVARITHTDFPCTFARQAVTGDSLWFAFASLADEEAAGWPHTAAALAAFAEIDRDPDPYRVLALCYDRADGGWEADDEALWSCLRSLAAHDEAGNRAVGTPGWTLRFAGLPWFFNVNGTAERNSRNAAGTLCFVVQRTDSFDGMAPEALHDSVRASIRRRLEPWDGRSASPLLAGGAANPDGVEWKQFHLPPDNEQAAPARCPFHVG